MRSPEARKRTGAPTALLRGAQGSDVGDASGVSFLNHDLADFFD
jgi:hypothetical protein